MLKGVDVEEGVDLIHGIFCSLVSAGVVLWEMGSENDIVGIVFRLSKLHDKEVVSLDSNHILDSLVGGWTCPE